MKKISLIASLLITALLFQECKKDSYTATATSTYSLIAIINDTTWTTDTVSAVLTYTATTHTKKFEFSGTANNKQVYFSILQNGQGNTSSFPIANFNNNSSNVFTSYLLKTKNSQGGYSYTPQGSVAAGSGFINITAVDSVKNLITGTFSLTSTSNIYGPDGQIVSVKVNQVQNGGFNNLPYKFVSQ